jgi:misacylated tRNA(Ala) deacylase
MEPAKVPPTTRVYWQDNHCFEVDATIIALQGQSIAFDRTCFYPGGGGQPADEGSVEICGELVLTIPSANVDADGVIWHTGSSRLPYGLIGQPARLMLNRDRRLALMRYHTVLHILNTIALRDYDGWITGVHIGADYSRIDFKLDDFSATLCADLERKVNAVIDENHALKSYTLPEAEFSRRTDLLRTLDAQPPVYQGQVRVVEIEGFDAQACGGMHMHTTAEVGRFSIFRTENKGKINKRLYVSLE